MKGNLYLAFRERGLSLGYKVWPTRRIRTKVDPARFRVPDLSPEDSALELRSKVDEYLTFRVP